jgi:hypothetical protein
MHIKKFLYFYNDILQTIYKINIYQMILIEKIYISKQFISIRKRKHYLFCNRKY